MLLLCAIHSSNSVVESQSSWVRSLLGHLQRWSAFSDANKQLGHLSTSDSFVTQNFDCCIASQILDPEVLEDNASSRACQFTSLNCSGVHPHVECRGNLWILVYCIQIGVVDVKYPMEACDC